jgi:uncharacterized protein (TIGR02246 family)
MLKTVFPVAGLMLAQLLVGAGVVDGQTTAAAADADKIDKEIRASADAFVAAFKKRDAAAIAAQWTGDGVYIDEFGVRFEGRKAIQTEYETLFKDAPDELAIQVEVDSIRLINEKTAIEEGRSAVMPQPPGASRVMSRYTAVHVNQDGRWLTAELRDTQLEVPPDAGELQDLGWLVGTWGSSKNDASVVIKCRWVENNRFLLRTHLVSESGTATDGGLEVIGVDPATQRITSWHFTNDGGHAVGVWIPMDGSWAVESLGVMEDGTETSATNILSRSDDDSLVWKSVDRMVGDVLLPDMPEVTLKREK